MVGSRYDYRIARQVIYLHQQRSHHALDFTRFVHVAAFLAHGIELVKEKDARCRPRVIEDAPQTACRLA